MPAPRPSPHLRRRLLGQELRRLREAAKLTGDQVIERVGWASASKLSRLENGRSRPELKDILALADLYGVQGSARDELATFTRDAGPIRTWMRNYPGKMTRSQQDYAALEAGCSDIREYCPVVVPGLLQTPEYAELRIVSSAPLRPATDKRGDGNSEDEVVARMSRQQLLTQVSEAPRYAAVIEESAFTRRAGPVEVIRRQLAHLREMAALPHVTVQIMPSDVVIENWYLPHTAFSLYRFPDPRDLETVAIEGISANLMNTDRDELNRYSVVFEWLQAAALSVEETLSWLDKRAGDGPNPPGATAIRRPAVPPNQRRRRTDRLTER